MDLVGAVVDSTGPLVAVEERQRRVVGETEAAVYLDGPVEHAHHGVGDVELDQRDFVACAFRSFPVHDPCRVKHCQPCGVDLGPALGDPPLHELLERQRAVGRDLAFDGPAAHKVERALADADPPHAMVDSAGAESFLRNPETAAFGAEQVFSGDSAVVEPDLGVAGPTFAARAHKGRCGLDDEAGRTGGDEYLAGAFVGRGVGIGDGHGDGEHRPVAARRPPFAAIDNIGVAVSNGGGAHPDGVGSGKIGLCHGETASDFAGEKGFEILLLLLIVGVLDEDFHVAGVRRLAVERVMADGALSEFGAEQAVLDEVEAKAAVLFRDLRKPQAKLFDLAPFFLQLGLDGVETLLQKPRFERIQLGFYKLARAVQQILKRLWYREIHGILQLIDLSDGSDGSDG